RGDTSGGGGKPATLETGAVVRVPLFVQSGEVIKCDLQKWVQISTEVDANGLELTEVDANESGNTTAFEERDGLQKSPRQPIKVDATGAKNNRHRV
ncbi:MAG: hypothetical protein KDJ31_05790, partial [Candidatus Competibacteraceae bacterium]|nr:hypothetical protein [Candidatus Competibacteraceae bacterium]